MVDDFSGRAYELFNQQIKDWNLAAMNYNSLKFVEEKVIDFDNCQIKLQYNPARAVSSNANVDKQSILKRPCFLCSGNLPEEQKGLPLSDNFVLLVNPFPIFFPHFTIPNLRHIPQQILPFFGNLLEITKKLPDFTIFYNGPACGASAPDHLHFQASPKGSMPVESEFIRLKKAAKKVEDNCWVIDNYLRTVLILEDTNEDNITASFQKIYKKLQSENLEEEPMMNIISSYENGCFRIFIFPRAKHRPQQYYAEDDTKILVSPGAVDMGGILIIPRKEDFDKITKEDIRDIYQQVSFSL